MQLSRAHFREATRRQGRRPLLAMLQAVVLLAAPAFGGVLPDDRADVFYHRYEGGGITIQGPEVLVRKKIGDSLSVSASYYEDLISSASIDVKLSASPYHEKRKQKTAGFDYLHGKTTYSAGIINSKEKDYQSNTTYYSVSQDMFGDLTTVSMSFKRGWDRVFADIKDATTGQIINQPSFGGFDKDGNPIAYRIADHRGYSLGLSQILTRSLIADFNYEVLTDEGYLQSPYRKIRYLSPGQGKGFTLADQVYPSTRTSNAVSVDLKYYMPWRAALDGQYRFFSDTWGIIANTFQLTYTQPAWKHWIFDGTMRYYTQTAADFYSDLFPRADYQNFMARDRELAAFNSYLVGVGASYEFNVPRMPWINKSSLNLRFDHLLIDYSDFRNALLTDSAAGITAGNEPLYKLNANIIQAFFSIWF
ncbi:MAG TPA: DUF3570 domain-containing protein [Steroidobacteraceae bacterium]